MEPMILLVDSANGIYSYQHLIENYKLYMENGGNSYIELKYMLEDDCIESLFNPDENEEWCENISYYEPLYIKTFNIKNEIYYCSKDYNGILHKEKHEYWRVESIDGDIFAINPKAVWSDSEDTYIMDK